jgi:hypothetical protein
LVDHPRAVAGQLIARCRIAKKDATQKHAVTNVYCVAFSFEAASTRFADVRNIVAIVILESAVQNLAIVNDAVAVAVGRPLDDVAVCF